MGSSDFDNGDSDYARETYEADLVADELKHIAEGGDAVERRVPEVA